MIQHCALIGGKYFLRMHKCVGCKCSTEWKANVNVNGLIISIVLEVVLARNSTARRLMIQRADIFFSVLFFDGLSNGYQYDDCQYFLLCTTLSDWFQCHDWSAGTLNHLLTIVFNDKRPLTRLAGRKFLCAQLLDWHRTVQYDAHHSSLGTECWR